MSEATRAAAAPGGGRPSHRWIKIVVVFLLITIPAGYLVISAIQSRGGGEDKQESAAASGLTPGYPSKVQRRIYDVPIPAHCHRVAFYERNSWKSSSLLVRFVTSRTGLHTFLGRLGSDPTALRADQVTIDAEEVARVGWKFDGGAQWAGLEIHQKDPHPEVEIMVKGAETKSPRVYVVSTVSP